MQLPESIEASYCRYTLHFNFTAITSRSSMNEKETWFIKLRDKQTGTVGYGECALFRGLSAEDEADYEEKLKELCEAINRHAKLPALSSSLTFGLETAYLDLIKGGKGILYNTPWSRGERSITINGLVWMGSAHEMQERVSEKLRDGFRCIKFKIGGIDFESELELIAKLRETFAPEILEIRLDANGAFTKDNALERINSLAKYTIHSLEQPIKPGQWFALSSICAKSPIPIALDEELIGVNDEKRKNLILSTIRPAYIILKPSLCGGLEQTKEWIHVARKFKTGWWVTSALESNIGLNAIAQFCSTMRLHMPQGLGTGQLYTNNIPSPLYLEKDTINYDPKGQWDYSCLPFNQAKI